MRILLTIALGLFAVASQAEVVPAEQGCLPALEQPMRKLHSRENIDLCSLAQGKPLLLVNTASHCGFTKQFKALEAVHKEYAPRGLVVIGFASNDFKQAAETEAEAADICYVNYGVSFTMLAQSAVRGEEANPVFQWIGTQAKQPNWNFNKYLVSADRTTVKRFGSMTKPQGKKFIQAVEALLEPSAEALLEPSAEARQDI